MSVYYDILTKVKTLLEADIDIQTVTRGGIDKIALVKQNMYSLAHVTTNNANLAGNLMVFNMSIFLMDVVDISKSPEMDLFKGNDNEEDVLNTTLTSLTRIMDQFRRGDVSEQGFQLQGSVTLEPFVERFEDNVAGWVATFNVSTVHGMTIC